MSFPYIAEPPEPIKRSELKGHVGLVLQRLRFIVWQILVPFRESPKDIPDIPEPKNEVEQEQLDHSQSLFDQAEQRRVHLEQKAQSTFSLMTFLVPLLASLFVFLISKTAGIGTMSRVIVLVLLTLAAVLLLLGFISAIRAVAVKANQALYLQSVLDETGQVRKFDRAFRLRGLLWCTSMNEAMNDHLAQFVKGAHLLTAGAVILVTIAAVPAAIMLNNLPVGPTATSIVGTVDVSSGGLKSLQAELAFIRNDLEALKKSKGSQDEVVALKNRIDALELKLKKPQKPLPRKQ
jgi:hypothetical protein